MKPCAGAVVPYRSGLSSPPFFFREDTTFRRVSATAYSPIFGGARTQFYPVLFLLRHGASLLGFWGLQSGTKALTLQLNSQGNSVWAAFHLKGSSRRERWLDPNLLGVLAQSVCGCRQKSSGVPAHRKWGLWMKSPVSIPQTPVGGGGARPKPAGVVSGKSMFGTQVPAVQGKWSSHLYTPYQLGCSAGLRPGVGIGRGDPVL